MNNDCLKLTTYFGERHRTEEQFVADALLDLYGRKEVEVSVMLRGAEGFGLKHHLRTDRMLTLSEDLPLVSVAVDTRPRIENLLDEVIAIKRHGLVTLERARMLTGEVGAVALPEELHEATKLTIYVGRQEQIDGRSRVHRGVRAAASPRHRRRHRAARRRRYRPRGAPARAVLRTQRGGAGDDHRGRRRRADRAGTARARGLLRRPLLTLERVRVCKRDGRLLSPPASMPATDEHGLAMWQKLMVYASEQARHGRNPLHVALVRRLRESGASGATCLRGIWGFHGDHAPHGDRLLQLRRHVPVVTIIVDTPERIAASFEIVDELTREAGLVTSEMVPAMASLSEGRRQRGGLRLARHRF